MKINGVECVFHHMGIPTMEERQGERYSPRFGMYTSDGECGVMRVQWHRFEPASSMHRLIQTIPHVAFKVEDLDRAVIGYNVLLGPYEPIPNFRVAIIENGGQPIEFVETTLTDEELWQRAESSKVLYPVDIAPSA